MWGVMFLSVSQLDNVWSQKKWYPTAKDKSYLYNVKIKDFTSETNV